MRNIIVRIALFCCLMPALAAAQNNTRFYLNDAAKKFMSNTQADSIMKITVRSIFEQYGNGSAFPSAYPGIGSLLAVQVGPKFIARVQLMSAGKKMPAPGTRSFDSIKQQLQREFIELVEQQFTGSYSFKRYLGLNVSDHITHFNANVTVRKDGSLLVEETIRIYNGNGTGTPTPADNLESEGGINNEIKRGIVRAFPTVYHDKYQVLHTTTFKLLSVERKGYDNEDWHMEKDRNGYKLYIGNESHFLPNGYYTYVIKYETSRQIKFLDRYDELYWNVTGNGWNFRMDSASCTIILPDSATVISGACYTGAYGDSLANCALRYTQTGNTIYAKTTRPLKPKQGLTLSVSWPKGKVFYAETKMQYLWRMFKSNQAIFLLPLLALLFGIYNFIAWWKVGRDPKPGVIYPEYYPPKGLSPAAMGYINNQGFENRLVAATITDWAVKKYITINVRRKGFIFKRNVYDIKDGGGKVQDSGYNDYERDSDDLENTTIQKGKYNKDLGDFRNKLKRELDDQYKATSANYFKGFFRLNNMYMAPGNLLTVLGAAYILFGVFTRAGMSNPWHGLYWFGGLVLCIVVQNIFYRLIKTYTPEGRKAMDQVEGFKMFLKAADEQRMNFLNPPKKDLQLYEKYLPFAVALGCEIEWGKQFEDIIKAAAIDPDSGGSIGSHSFSSHNFSSSFSSSFASSLSGAISSASTPPSSSSGGGSSFGGGFSGGGGGGGGGGGW